MAETTKIARNTFRDGLMMDLAPDNTQNTVLTNALNATLFTYNGNELSLQNDMGNGRVETAFLPKGYVPVGTCEFGGIIYIVSYNPLENKSQIGCFPSPERNINNKEISDLQVVFKSSELATNGKIQTNKLKKILFANSNINPGDKFIVSWGTKGALNASKISDYGNTDQTLGIWPKLVKVHIVSIEEDGKIQYLDSSVKWYDNNFYINNANLSDSLQDQEIDSYRDAVSSAYSVFQSKISGKLALMLELEEIKGFDCAHKVIKRPTDSGDVYDVYLSVSWDSENPNINPCGLMFTTSEGEGIEEIGSKTIFNEGFNCKDDYSFARMVPLSRTYKQEDPGNSYEDFITTNQFDVQKLLYTQWERYCDYQDAITMTQAINKLNKVYKDKSPIPAEDNMEFYVVNAAKVDTDGTFRTAEGIKVNGNYIPDDVVVNHFKHSTLKYIGTVKLTDESNNHILNYVVCPCMPYGPLTHLGISGKIDFSKVGTGKIDLDTWRYYVTNDNIILNWGLDVNLDDREGIKLVEIQFIDNQGIAANCIIENRDSFSGKFTEYINLENSNSHLTLSNQKYNRLSGGFDYFYHAYGGETIYDPKNSKDAYVVYDPDTKTASEYTGAESKNIRINDAGILHTNWLYLCKIIVHKGYIDELNNVILSEDNEPEIIYRWLWTSSLFNSNYTQIQDFSELQVEFQYGIEAQVDGRGMNKPINNEFNGISTQLEELTDTTLYKAISINQTTTEGNINVKIGCTLDNNYGCFVPLGGSVNDTASNPLENIKVTLSVNNNRIQFDNKPKNEYSFTQVYENKDRYVSNEYLEPVISEYKPNSKSNYFELEDGYKSFADYFKISLKQTDGSKPLNITYVNDDGESLIASSTDVTSLSLRDAYEKGFDLNFLGIFNSKLMACENTKMQLKELRSVIGTEEDMESNNLGISNRGMIYFKEMATFIGGDYNSGDPDLNIGRLSFVNDLNFKYELIETSSHSKINLDIKSNNRKEPEDVEKILKEFNIGFGQGIVPVIYTARGKNDWNVAMAVEDPEKINGLLELYGGPTPAYDASKKYNIINGVFAVIGVQTNASGESFGLFTKGYDEKCKTHVPTLLTSLSLYDAKTEARYPIGDLQLQDINFEGGFKKLEYSSSKPVSLAQAVGSLLGQLYYATETDEYLNLWTNIVTLKPYTENWKSDLVFKFELDPKKEKTLDSGKLVGLINTVDQEYTSIYDLVNQIISKANIKKQEIELTNVTPVILPSYKCLQLQYDNTYNTGNLYGMYQDMAKGLSTLYNFTDKGNKVSITSNVELDQLYVFDGSNSVSKYSKTTQMRLLRDFTKTVQGNICATACDQALALNKLSNLSSILKVDNGIVTTEDITKLQGYAKSYTIKWDTDDDIRLTSPNINIFKYTK